MRIHNTFVPYKVCEAFVILTGKACVYLLGLKGSYFEQRYLGFSFRGYFVGGFSNAG